MRNLSRFELGERGGKKQKFYSYTFSILQILMIYCEETRFFY